MGERETLHSHSVGGASLSDSGQSAPSRIHFSRISRRTPQILSGAGGMLVGWVSSYFNTWMSGLFESRGVGSPRVVAEMLLARPESLASHAWYRSRAKMV